MKTSSKTHRAKKSLGQNFLKSQSVVEKIIEAGNLSKKDTVVEIGPGKGALTEKLLESAGKVIAIEKDNELCDFLKEKFKTEIEKGVLELINEDVLRWQPNGKYKILANIPYNITGAILKKFLTENNQPEIMILMVQKEVASRILARDQKESILSVSVKAYATPKLVTKVEARYFYPKPRVDSAVISISKISRDLFNNDKKLEENFWKLVHFGFAHKRKKLSGNLKNIISKENLAKMSLADKRAEDLPISSWLALAQML